MKLRAILGEYKIGKTLGEGSFSKVKLATDGNGEKFAVKVIDKKKMREIAIKSKKSQEERERQRIITQRKKARSESIKKQNLEYHASSEAEGPLADVGPLDLQKLIKDLAEINAEIENVELPQEVIRPESEYMPSIQKEVKLLMRLDHPNIIKTYKIFDSEDECYIIMELAKGGELMEYITTYGKLTEKESRKFFRQIVSAIDHIHSANIVHRDLKLENVLLSKDIDCLISDFGLGRTYQNECADDMKTFCGTPNYASIELVAGIPYNGIKSDIWALGVILYIMVSGKRPFMGSTLAILYQRILKLEYDILPYFSPELTDLLKKIFVRDPKKRIDIHQIRDHPWMNVDFPEKIPLVPAKPALEDPEDIGKVIGSIYNDSDFTVYTLKAHSTSIKNSPNNSNSSVKSVRNMSNPSSLRMEVNNSSKSVAEYLPPPTTKGRRASLQECVQESKSYSFKMSFQHSELSPVEHQHSLQSKTGHNEPNLLVPNSFSNELSRRPSTSSHISVDTRSEASAISQSNTNNESKHRTSLSIIGRGSSSAIKNNILDVEEDLDISDAADLAAQNIGRSRRMSIGPDKRATIQEETSLDPSPDSDDEFDGNVHDEYSLKEYSYARRPSYRRASLVEQPKESRKSSLVRVDSLLVSQVPVPPKESPSSFGLTRRDSISSRPPGTIAKEAESIPARSGAIMTVSGSSGIQSDIRKRAATVTGTSGYQSGQSSSKFLDEDHKRFYIWEDQDSSNRTSSFPATSKISNGGDHNPAITMEIINNWHEIHRPARSIRTMRYSFNKSTTNSIYDPARIFQDLHKVLLDMADAVQEYSTLKFVRPSDLYLFECTVEYPHRDDSSKFEVEVCKVWLLKMHGIRIKRLYGDIFDYKKLNSDLVERLGYHG